VESYTRVRRLSGRPDVAEVAPQKRRWQGPLLQMSVRGTIAFALAACAACAACAVRRRTWSPFTPASTGKHAKKVRASSAIRASPRRAVGGPGGHLRPVPGHALGGMSQPGPRRSRQAPLDHPGPRRRIGAPQRPRRRSRTPRRRSISSPFVRWAAARAASSSSRARASSPASASTSSAWARRRAGRQTDAARAIGAVPWCGSTRCRPRRVPS